MLSAVCREDVDAEALSGLGTELGPRLWADNCLLSEGLEVVVDFGVDGWRLPHGFVVVAAAGVLELLLGVVVASCCGVRGELRGATALLLTRVRATGMTGTEAVAGRAGAEVAPKEEARKGRLLEDGETVLAGTSRVSASEGRAALVAAVSAAGLPLGVFGVEDGTEIRQVAVAGGVTGMPLWAAEWAVARLARLVTGVTTRLPSEVRVSCDGGLTWDTGVVCIGVAGVESGTAWLGGMGLFWEVEGSSQSFGWDGEGLGGALGKETFLGTLRVMSLVKRDACWAVESDSAPMELPVRVREFKRPA